MATFEILNGSKEVVATVFVSEECVAERKAAEGWQDWKDSEVASIIFEDRYESALNNAGFSYEQAEQANFDFRRID